MRDNELERSAVRYQICAKEGSKTEGCLGSANACADFDGRIDGETEHHGLAVKLMAVDVSMLRFCCTTKATAYRSLDCIPASWSSYFRPNRQHVFVIGSSMVIWILVLPGQDWVVSLPKSSMVRRIYRIYAGNAHSQ